MCDTAIPLDYFPEAPQSFERRGDALKLLWVGRMQTRKALPLALDALKEAQPNVKLTIAGDGLAPEIVQGMIRDRHLEQRVFWKGDRLTFQELRIAYAEHDAMLFTSLRDSFGSQLLEAMAMGLPVITLDLHGAHDFVPENAGLKVPVSTPEETVRNLAAAIDRYASFSPSTKNEMSMCGWSFAKTLSWPARAELVEKLYEEILSRNALQDSNSVSSVATANSERVSHLGTSRQS